MRYWAVLADLLCDFPIAQVCELAVDSIHDRNHVRLQVLAVVEESPRLLVEVLSVTLLEIHLCNPDASLIPAQ